MLLEDYDYIQPKLTKREPEDIRDRLNTRIIDNSNEIYSIQERGRLDLITAGVAEEMWEWESFLSEIIDEGNLVTANIEENIENLAKPYYDRIYSNYGYVLARIKRNDSLDEDNVKPELFFIAANTFFSTDNLDPIQYKPIHDFRLYAGEDIVYVRCRSVEKGTHTSILEDSLNIVDGENSNLITVHNPARSWGAVDTQRIDIVRDNALNARFTLEKATLEAVKLKLEELGYVHSQYNIIEFVFGKGTYIIYIKTDSDVELNNLKIMLQQPVSGAGISYFVTNAVPSGVKFNFEIQLANNTKLTASEQTEFKADLLRVLQYHIEISGVGRTIYYAKLVRDMYDNLGIKWALNDIHVSTDRNNVNMDLDRVHIQPYEYLDLLDVNINLKTINMNLLNEDDE